MVSRSKAFVLLAVLVTVGCKRPTTTECDSMLDRYLDMTEDDDPALEGLTDSPRASVRTERLAQRRASPGYARAQSRCTAEVSPSAYECAMKAPTPNDWEACLTP